MKDNSKTNKIVLENVSHSFGQIDVLNNLNFSVNPGEFVVIVGPSGCGKTTLLNLISGYINPSSGKVQREGIIRTVFQQDGLFPWLTVAENIKMGLRSIPDEEVREKELKNLFELIHIKEL